MLEIDDASSVVREVPESFDRNRVLGVPLLSLSEALEATFVALRRCEQWVVRTREGLEICSVQTFFLCGHRSSCSMCRINSSTSCRHSVRRMPYFVSGSFRVLPAVPSDGAAPPLPPERRCGDLLSRSQT